MKINVSSSSPQVIVYSLMNIVRRFDDTEENRREAVKIAEGLWATSPGTPVQVQRWKSGAGDILFKRTEGHCIG